MFVSKRQYDSLQEDIGRQRKEVDDLLAQVKSLESEKNKFLNLIEILRNEKIIDVDSRGNIQSMFGESGLARQKELIWSSIENLRVEVITLSDRLIELKKQS